MQTLLERLNKDQNPNPLRAFASTAVNLGSYLMPSKESYYLPRIVPFAVGGTVLFGITVGSKVMSGVNLALKMVGQSITGGSKLDINQQNTLGNALDQILQNLNKLMADVSNTYELGSLRVLDYNSKDNEKSPHDLISRFDPVSHPEDFEKFFVNVQTYLDEKKKTVGLTPFEQNASTITVDRMRDVILYGKNRHMYSNWADTLCATPSVAYTENAKETNPLKILLNPGKYILRTDFGKNMKQFFVSTDRVFNRNLDAPLDWIPLVIRRPEDLTSWKKIFRMAQVTFGAAFGNNGKGENVNSILYSDLTVDASAQTADKTYDPSLVFNYCWDKALDSLEHIFTKLENQKDLFDKAVKSGKTIYTNLAAYEKGVDVRKSFTGDINIKSEHEFFSINEIYCKDFNNKTDLEFNQKKALMFVQINDVVSGMDERTGTRTYKGLDNKTMMLAEMVVARVNELIDQNGGVNFTGLKFFDRDRSKKSIERTVKALTKNEKGEEVVAAQKDKNGKDIIREIPAELVGLQTVFPADNEDERRFLLTLVERLVRGSIPEGYHDLAFVRSEAVTTSMKKVNLHVSEISKEFSEKNRDVKDGSHKGYGLIDEKHPYYDVSPMFEQNGRESKRHFLKELAEGKDAENSTVLRDYIAAKKEYEESKPKNDKNSPLYVVGSGKAEKRSLLNTIKGHMPKVLGLLMTAGAVFGITKIPGCNDKSDSSVIDELLNPKTTIDTTQSNTVDTATVKPEVKDVEKKQDVQPEKQEGKKNKVGNEDFSYNVINERLIPHSKMQSFERLNGISVNKQQLG